MPERAFFYKGHGLKVSRRLTLAALLLAAAPLHAQNAGTHRFDGGTFSVELPAGIPALQLLRDGGRTQIFGGRHADGSVVLVLRGRATGQVTDTASARRTLMRMSNDSAAVERRLQDLGDLSRRDPDAVLDALADTTLEARRFFLQQVHAAFVQFNQAEIGLSGDAREIVTDERVALRSPVTLRLAGSPPLQGTADVLIPRRGAMTMVWIVAYAAPRRTPAFDAAAQRTLDSFRVTGGR
jgi:hypothetical protein